MSNGLRNRFIGISTLIGVLTIGIAYTGYWTVEELKVVMEDQALVADAITSHMEADMMHDTIRGDVLGGLLAASRGESLEGVQADLKEHVNTLKESILTNQNRELPTEAEAAIQEVIPALNDYSKAATDIVALSKLSYDAAIAKYPSFLEQFKHLEDAMEKVSGSLDAWSEAQVGSDSFVVKAESFLLVLFGIALIAVLVVPFTMQSLLFKPLGRVTKQIAQLAQGDTALEITGTDRNDEIGQLAKSMEEIRTTAVDSVRLKLALDTSTSNVMMADTDLNIVYLNQAVANFLQEAESDIRKDLPRFDVSKLKGANIDIFHKNPTHQRSMLEKLADTYKTSIIVGGRSFNLVANPIFDTNKQRLGTVVEWLDGAAVGMVDAIKKSQAVIEFQPDGTIINANENFLSVMGYSLDEIKGKHHSMFVDHAYRASPEYKQFWDALNRGEPQVAEFKRLGKGGKEVWIQASYNPIADWRGKIVRVVKTASNVTQMVQNRTENEFGMNEAVKVLTAVSEGNLTQRMDGEYKGAFADIKRALNATIDKLIEIVKQIVETAQSVNTAAGEIASGSSDLSMRTEQQASSLEETAASMEEITGTVRQNSANAGTANELSINANTVADNGGRVVSEAVVAMGSIEKSSQKISDIISVIDEIAFQTNLLALNAAVEAARAGDAGKGFAVVASEVRSLAGRSATASKEIKTLINESAGQVKTGAQLVNKAGDTLKDIVSSVKQVASIVSEIAAASQQQATGIDEINSAVAQMDEVTQQNAALVEENTAAAQSMLEQSKGLETLVGFFQIDESMETDMPTAREKVSVAKATKPAVRPVHKSGNGHANGATHAPRAKVSVASAASAKAADDGWEEF